MYHALLQISLPSLHNYHVKWRNLKSTREQERQGDKFYHLSLNSDPGARTRSPLFSSDLISLLSGNSYWVTFYKDENVWKDAKSVFQRRRHWRRRRWIVRSLISQQGKLSRRLPKITSCCHHNYTILNSIVTPPYNEKLFLPSFRKLLHLK